MKISVNVKAGLSARMSSSMQAGLRMLSQNLIELDKTIEDTLQNNPFLEAVEPVYEAQDDYGFSDEPSADCDGTNFEILRVPVKEPLKDSLCRQLRELGVQGVKRELCYWWVDSLSEQGRMTKSVEECVKENRLATFSTAETALSICRDLEPAGLFARDVIECFVLQCKSKPWLAKFIEIHMASIMELGVTMHCRKFNIDRAILEQYLAYVRPLRRSFGEAAETPSLEVDAVVEEDSLGKLQVILTTHKNVQLSNYGNRKQGEELWDEARALIRMLRKRHDTLQRTLNAVVSVQDKFFRTLDQKDLKPMSRDNIADIVKLHSTTINRAVANKAVQVGNQVISLDSLFSSRVSDTSVIAAQEYVSSLLRLYPHAVDREIAHIMTQRGMPIARRTVTKYREALKVRPASAR